MVSPSDESPPVKKRFRIQKRRLGKVKFLSTNGDYGFIAAEDFREDVFFHTSNWRERLVTKDGQTKLVELSIDLWVEFELDDEQLETEKRLRAKVVRPTDRPTGRKLSGRDATFHIVTHHPRARKKRPSWREK
jgi:cold shock CspA family protein